MTRTIKTLCRKRSDGLELLSINRLAAQNSKNDNTEILLNAAVNYKILKGLDIDVKYQYQRLSGLTTNLNDDESYYARNMINSFARSNADGSVGFIVPKGGIMIKSNTLATVNNLRGQINYNNTVKA